MNMVALWSQLLNYLNELTWLHCDHIMWLSGFERLIDIVAYLLTFKAIFYWIFSRNHSHIDIWVQPACFLRHNGISRIHRVARSIKLQVHYLRSAHVDGKEQWFSTLFDLQHPSFLIEPFGGTPVENHWYRN